MTVTVVSRHLARKRHCKFFRISNCGTRIIRVDNVETYSIYSRLSYRSSATDIHNFQYALPIGETALVPLFICSSSGYSTTIVHSYGCCPEAHERGIV